MSTNKPPKKKVVVTSKKKDSPKKVQSTDKGKKGANTRGKTKAKSRRSSAKTEAPSRHGAELIFSRQQIYLMLGGLALILIGLALMTGGSMPDPNVWDEKIIYSGRRITVAPILILLGMGVEIYAIFKK